MFVLEYYPKSGTEPRRKRTFQGLASWLFDARAGCVVESIKAAETVTLPCVQPHCQEWSPHLMYRPNYPLVFVSYSSSILFVASHCPAVAKLANCWLLLRSYREAVLSEPHPAAVSHSSSSKTEVFLASGIVGQNYCSTALPQTPLPYGW